MWLCIYLFLHFLDKEFGNRQNEKKNQKNQRKILKKIKELIMIKEIVNEDIGKTAKSVGNPEEAVEVVSNIEKVIKSNKYDILWLAYQQGQIFEILAVDEIFINGYRT